jgi:hypothetical protein
MVVSPPPPGRPSALGYTYLACLVHNVRCDLEFLHYNTSCSGNSPFHLRN